MVYDKIKERKRIFPDKDKDKGKPKDERDEEDIGTRIEMPEERLVKACPGVKNPTLIFKDGKFMRV